MSALVKKPHGPMSATEKSDRVLDKVIERIEANADFAIEATQAAAEYDDDVDHLQVTEEEIKRWGNKTRAITAKRIAKDARKPKKDAPMYLDENFRLKAKIMDHRIKREMNEAKKGAKFNNSHITVNVLSPSAKRPEDDYGVIDLIPEDDK